MSHYPEHDRLGAVHDRSQAIGEFLEWLAAEKGWHLGAHVVERDYEPGERYEIVESEYRGTTSYRVNDLDPFCGGYTGQRHETRESAEAAAALLDEDYIRGTENNRVYRQQSYDVQRLLAEFFGIDLNKIEAEKRAMLEHIRAANG